MYRFRLLALGALLCASAPLTAQTPDRAAFVAMLGKDTMFVEQYSRAGNQVTGDLLQRSPTTVITHYVVHLDEGGRASSIEISQRKPDGSVAPNLVRSGTLAFANDSVAIEVTRDTTVRRRFAATDAFPVFSASVGLTEVVLARLRRARVDSMDVGIVGPGSQRPGMLSVKMLPDSARVWNLGFLIHYRVDATGRVLGVDARQTTQKYEARRLSGVDLAGIATRFAAAEAAGQGFGRVASPRDTARANGIWVDYGRPATRGRDVWKNGVLGDSLWRTGANAATQFHTDADLVVGGAAIPAGTYTLWTHTIRDGAQYELVFNKQTGQWGTEHDAAQDLARVPLVVSRLATPVERFTIAVDDPGSGGAIRLQWGTQQLSVPFDTRAR